MRIDEILLSDDKKQRRLSELYRVFGGREARLLAVIELLSLLSSIHTTFYSINTTFYSMKTET